MRIGVQLLCCRTLWTDSHRLEYATVADLASFVSTVCDSFLFFVSQNTLGTLAEAGRIETHGGFAADFERAGRALCV